MTFKNLKELNTTESRSCALVFNFNNKELIKIIDLMNLGCKIIFVWYRNWWMNKNEEVQKIHKLLNEQ